MSQNKNLIIAGRAGVDLYAREHNTNLKEVKSFERYVGGAGANIAVQAARLSGKSTLLTQLANDPWGDYIKNYLADSGVNIPTPPAPLGTLNSLAITEIKSRSKVLFYRQNPADLHLSPEHINKSWISAALGVILTGTALSSTPSRESIDLILFYAEHYSIPTILDLDYRPGFSHEWEVFLSYRRVMEKCDILIGTEEEFDRVLDFLRKSKEDGKKFLQFKTNEDIAHFFLTGKTQTVIIKRGADGSTAYQKKRGSKKVNKVKGGVFPVKLVKNFGAGDAFAATFCHYYLRKTNLSIALKRAAAAAAIVVSRESCTEAMPTERELFNFIKSHRYT